MDNTTPAATAERVAKKIAEKGLQAVAKRAQRLQRLVVEYVSPSEVKPNTYNPNRQKPETLELLKLSMKQDGFTQPIVAQRSTGEIVDGEHRWRAARALGLASIPVVFVDMTTEQMRIATLRHNRARGSEDLSLALEVLRDLQELGAMEWAQGALQLSDDELARLLNDEPVHELLGQGDFSEAWIPERGDKESEDDHDSFKVVEREIGAGVSATALTRAAAAESIKRKASLQNASSSEAERTDGAKKFAPPYRLQFTLTGDDAEIVRDVLGDEPAEALLAICMEEIAKSS